MLVRICGEKNACKQEILWYLKRVMNLPLVPGAMALVCFVLCFHVFCFGSCPGSTPVLSRIVTLMMSQHGGLCSRALFHNKVDVVEY